MKIKTFIVEKSYVFVIALIVSMIEIAFFVASGNNLDTILFFLVLLWLFVALIIVIEYKRKSGFYNRLDSIFTQLEKKYLIHEMIDPPGFQEGKILYELLLDLNKNLNDTINAYAIREKDYQEYVELWVHEIKTPLAAGKLIAENNQSSSMKRMDEELSRIDDFVEQALYYARSTSLEKDYVLKYSTLADNVNKVIKKHKDLFLYKNIKVDLHDLDNEVYSDSKWLEFILHQIIDNALKYTLQDGTIACYSEVEKENVVLCIQDNGIGIEEKDLQRIFERGFTGENGRVYNKATGLGLYICQLLCDKLYIGIEVHSSPHKGTLVKLIFPISSMMKLK